jgi:hypothetical protein
VEGHIRAECDWSYDRYDVIATDPASPQEGPVSLREVFRDLGIAFAVCLMIVAGTNLAVYFLAPG